MGVTHVSIFHGQLSMSLSRGRAWRVDGNDHNGNVACGTNANARRGWTCPPNTGMWYVGTARNVDGLRGLGLAMHTWGEQLFADGYVNTLGLRLIIAPPFDSSPPNAEIDPANPGTVVRRWETTPASYPYDPYTFSFRIENNAYVWSPPETAPETAP